MRSHLFASMATIAMLLSSCTPTPPTQIETKILTASGAQQVFNDLFRSYQSGFTTVPWDGEFDFEGTVNIDGDAKKIESLGLHTFQQPFSSFSTKAYGYYSFSNLLSPQIDITIKSYLNTENTGRGDLDMSLQTTQSGGMQLQVNSLERKLLTFFEFSDETIEALLVSFEKNKGLAQEFPIGGTLLQQIIQALQSHSGSTALHKNTEAEEEKIITAFLQSSTVEVLSGSILQDGTRRIYYRLNTQHLSNFLGEVGSILGKGNEQKDFSKSVQDLDRFFRLNGSMDIKNNRLIQSNHYLLVRMQQEQGGKIVTDDLVFKIQLSLPNPQRFDMDIDTSFWANSLPENVFRFRFKGLLRPGK